MCKYIFVTGGVCSSLGKGITTASIGALLKSAGLTVFTQKLDPYLNVDPGTMSPFQHGEVYVTNDGAETDLDLGHYERFMDIDLTKDSSVTTGKIYLEVLNKERQGEYLGGTIQVIPHITNAIKDRITKTATKAKCDVMIIEIGGTVGDIEGLPYIEAIRQMRHDFGKQNTLFVHLTLLPYLAGARELKTKPTQASVRELRGFGIQPDIILARADKKIKTEQIDKIARFCDVDHEAVIPAPTVKSIYTIPIHYYESGLGNQILQKLRIPRREFKLDEWYKVKKLIDNNDTKKVVNIGLVTKYTGLDDAYLSIIESLKIACFQAEVELEIHWIDAEKLEQNHSNTHAKLKEVDAIIVPGGFGKRGIEGKIIAANYARKNKIPYLGICLGMQLMAVEFAREVLGNKQITSEEFDEEKIAGKENYLIHYLPGQSDNIQKGGTQRLGAYDCHLKIGTQTYNLFKKATISERHRHRYEFNNDFRKPLEDKGLIISGINPKDNLVEMIELPGHPFMIGTQSHPEFLSRPTKPHPLFSGLITATIKHSKN